MLRVVSLLLFLAALAWPALAWQPVAPVADGTSDQVILLYGLTGIKDSGAGKASDVQVKNTGTGTLTVSMWQYVGSAWKKVLPFATGAGETFNAVADSAFTVGAGEQLNLLDLPPSSRVQRLVITRPVSTSFKVLFQ
jgi:hypothetical protein